MDAAPVGGRRQRERDELDPARLGPEVVERYLRRHGLDARRRHSQNHLVDRDILEAIVDAAAPARGRRILEIGPGLGILTGALLARGAHVTAVEVDPRLFAHLERRFDALDPAVASDPDDHAARVPAVPVDGSLRLVQADILDTPLASVIEPPYDLVANLPYHITSPVLHHALDAGPRPERFVLMLQREVAERITAAPGGLSYLSVFVQYHADVRLVRTVPASAFEPAPSVDSAVIAGETRPRVLAPGAEAELWRIVQAGFRERRKMVHNVLPRQLPTIGAARISDALARAGIEPHRRPQTLSVEEWLMLAREIGPLG